jgi:hypothetical protein
MARIAWTGHIELLPEFPRHSLVTTLIGVR